MFALTITLAACGGGPSSSNDGTSAGGGETETASGKSEGKLTNVKAVVPAPFEEFDGSEWKATYPGAPTDTGPFRGDCGKEFGAAVGLGDDKLLGAQCTIYAAGDRSFMVMTPTIIGVEPEVWIQCQGNDAGTLVPSARVQGSLSTQTGLTDSAAGLAVIVGAEAKGENTFYLFDATSEPACAASKVVATVPSGNNGSGGTDRQWLPDAKGPGWCIRAESGAWTVKESDNATCFA